MFYLHWILAFMDYNYQEHYWHAVEERKLFNFILGQTLKDLS